MVVNTEKTDDARKTAELLCALSGFPKRETQDSWFINEQIEVMKSQFRGTDGRIAAGTAEIACAKNYLESRGVAFDPATENRSTDGRLGSIYLKDEIAGFAFHPVQKG